VEPADEITLVDNINPVMAYTSARDALMNFLGVTCGNYGFGVVGIRKTRPASTVRAITDGGDAVPPQIRWQHTMHAPHHEDLLRTYQEGRRPRRPSIPMRLQPRGKKEAGPLSRSPLRLAI
jgi:hypothetical protein